MTVQITAWPLLIAGWFVLAGGAANFALAWNLQKKRRKILAELMQRDAETYAWRNLIQATADLQDQLVTASDGYAVADPQVQAAITWAHTCWTLFEAVSRRDTPARDDVRQ